MLWAGVSGELEKLQELQRSVVSATAPLGFRAEERPYAPHLTLARKYRDELPFDQGRLGNLRVQKPGGENNCSGNDWTVDAFVVYATRIHAIPMYEMIGNLTFF
ncbi:RNA 2',3'-cyclic phosphodiesterase [compost metagenome]